MAVKTYKLGTHGPYKFDDTYAFKDASTAKALTTDSNVEASATPSDDNDLTRLIDGDVSLDTAIEISQQYTLLICQ